MAAEVTVSRLKKKLVHLRCENGIVYPRLKRRIEGYIMELRELEAFLEKAAAITSEQSKRPSFPPEVLKAVYSAEDFIDDYLMKSSLRRQWSFFRKMHLFAAVISAWNQLRLSRKMYSCSQVLATKISSLPRLSASNATSTIQRLRDFPSPFDTYFTEYEKVNMQESTAHSEEESTRGAPDPEGSQGHVEKFASFPEKLDSIGMDDQEKDLVQLVLGKHKLLHLISVAGPSGSGKTTLVKRVCARTDVRQHFECGAWVSVANQFEEQDLLIDVLSQVTMVTEEEMLPLESLQKHVRHFLSRKRYLVVLNDIQDHNLWGTIKSTFPNSLNGSRVIVTVRDPIGFSLHANQWVSTLQMLPLTNEESWDLFLKKVRKTKETLNESEVVSLKEKILSKCKGLPLSLVLLGGLLSAKELNHEEWLKVIDQATLSTNQSTSWDILSWGYQDLASPLKACLLYLGLFPRSYEISKRRLLHLWVAEGLATAESKVTPEDVVEGYLKELVGRNLIEVARWRLDGGPRTFRVPGILYDTLFPDAAKMGFFHVHKNFDCMPNPEFKVRRIAEYLDIGSYPASDPYSICHLRSYISFNCRKGDSPTDGFDKLLRKILASRGFGLLSVLDLEHVYKPVLSESLGKLLHLKYLGLRWTFLDSIPMSIGKLRCLETLDMKHTNITSLPISIWNMTKLCHLYINDIHFDMSAQLQNPSSSFTSSLVCLRTLWGLLIGSNSSVVTWLQRLTNLRKLGLTCHVSSIEKMIDWITGLKHLQSLRLRAIDKFNQPADLNLKTLKEHNDLNELYLLGKLPRIFNAGELPQNLKILTLSVSQLWEDPMPILGKLPRLNILRLFAASYVGAEMNCLNTGFPELRVLKLWMLEELKMWTIQEGSLPCLKELEIRSCLKLELPGGLKHVTTLKELTLTNMPGDFRKQMKETLRKNNMLTKINNWDFLKSRKNVGKEQ